MTKRLLVVIPCSYLFLASCSPEKETAPPSASEDSPLLKPNLAELIEENRGADYARIEPRDGQPVTLLDLRGANQHLSMLFRDVQAGAVEFGEKLQADWLQGDYIILTGLSGEQANTSFSENVDLDLPIDGRASGAITRRISGRSGEEIVYHFRGSGLPQVAEPTRLKLSKKWKGGEDDQFWLPGAAFISDRPDLPNIFMGSFDGESFELALWVDRAGSDLFVSYREKAEPAGETLRD